LFGFLFRAWVIAIAGAVLLSSGVCESAASRRPDFGDGARSIEATPASITFTNARQTKDQSCVVRLSNISNSKVTVTRIIASGSAVAISDIGLPLAMNPGESFTFQVFYSPESSGANSGAILIVNDADQYPLVINVASSLGPSSSGLSADSSILNFDKVTLGTTVTQNLTLTNSGGTNVTVSRVAVSGDAFSLDGAAQVALAPRQSFSIGVHFNPNAPGTKGGIISVFSDAAAMPLQVSLSGEGVPASHHSVVVQWNPDPAAVNGYFIYRGSQPGGPYTKLNSSASVQPEFEDSSLAAGQTYYYVITSVDSSNGEGEQSNEVIITVPQRPVATGIKITFTPRGIDPCGTSFSP